MNSDENQSLIEAIRQGSEIALKLLFDKFYFMLCHWAHKWVKSKDLAEEVVADVFAQIWIKRTTLPQITNVSHYLHSAVKNQSLNMLKKEPVSEDYNNLDPNMYSISHEGWDQMVVEETKNLMHDIIDRMPEQRRKIFIMNRLEGLKYKEIADLLSISIHTVQNQMVTAVKQINALFHHVESHIK